MAALLGLTAVTVASVQPAFVSATTEPYATDPHSAFGKAAQRALVQAFPGKDLALIREGGSIPIVNTFKRVLGVESLLLGLALPDDNAHSANEKFDLDCFKRGQLMSAHLWQELRRV